MPYTIVPRDGAFCIFKEDAAGKPTGDAVNCHTTHNAAVAQIAAIMASERKARVHGKSSPPVMAGSSADAPAADIMRELEALLVPLTPSSAPAPAPAPAAQTAESDVLSLLCGVFAEKAGYEVSQEADGDCSWLHIALPTGGHASLRLSQEQSIAPAFRPVDQAITSKSTAPAITYLKHLAEAKEPVAEEPVVEKVTEDTPEDTRGDDGETCVCQECGYEAPHTAGTPCVDKACPKCGAKMLNGFSDAEEEEGDDREDIVTESGQRKEAFTSVWNRLGAGLSRLFGFTVATKDRGDEEFDRVLTLVKELQSTGTGQSFFTVKSGARYRWVAISSSYYQDQDGEIVSQVALEKDVASNPLNRGNLLFWHEPNLVLGSCDFGAVSDGFLIEAGYWGDDALGVAARKAVQQSGSRYGISIGFLAKMSDTESGMIGGRYVSTVYNTIETKERSLLPAKYASNMYTNIVTQEGDTMDPRKLDEFKSIVGEPLANAILAQLAAKKTTATVTGAVSKEAGPSLAEVLTKALGEAGYATEATAIVAALAEIAPAPVPAEKDVQLPPAPAALPPQPAVTPSPEAVTQLAELLKELGTRMDAIVTEIAAVKAEQSTRQGLIRPTQMQDNITAKAAPQLPSTPSKGEVVLDDIAKTIMSAGIVGGV